MSDVAKYLQTKVGEILMSLETKMNAHRITEEQKSLFKRMIEQINDPIVIQAEAEAEAEKITPVDQSQALIVSFQYGLESLDDFYEMDELLYEFFQNSETVSFDGHEISVDATDGTLFFYGPDADSLFDQVTPVLKKFPFMSGAECLRRYGDADDENAKQIKTHLKF